MSENIQVVQHGGKLVYVVARPRGVDEDGRELYEAALLSHSRMRPIATMKRLLDGSWPIARFADREQAEHAANIAFPEPRPEPTLAEQQAARAAEQRSALASYEWEQAAHRRLVETLIDKRPEPTVKRRERRS
jgi:hypothetical protein